MGGPASAAPRPGVRPRPRGLNPPARSSGMPFWRRQRFSSPSGGATRLGARALQHVRPVLMFQDRGRREFGPIPCRHVGHCQERRALAWTVAAPGHHHRCVGRSCTSSWALPCSSRTSWTSKRSWMPSALATTTNTPAFRIHGLQPRDQFPNLHGAPSSRLPCGGGVLRCLRIALAYLMLQARDRRPITGRTSDSLRHTPALSDGA
jgi:hypothetical protein